MRVRQAVWNRPAGCCRPCSTWQIWKCRAKLAGAVCSSCARRNYQMALGPSQRDRRWVVRSLRPLAGPCSPGESSLEAVAAGLNWLSQDRPRDSVFWRRWLRRLSPARHRSRKNAAYRGWGWNPYTSSWVEPTSVALIVLSRCLKEMLPAGANQRRQSAEAMLYDRMCPGGGWNCGDPLVYGVPGKPLVIPTAWALLALRSYPQRTENLVSLDWLERTLPDEQGPGSLALAQICFGAYGRKWPATAKSPEDLYSNNEFLGSTTTMAWVCLAANSRRSWLTGESGETPR